MIFSLHEKGFAQTWEWGWGWRWGEEGWGGEDLGGEECGGVVWGWVITFHFVYHKYPR